MPETKTQAALAAAKVVLDLCRGWLGGQGLKTSDLDVACEDLERLLWEART
jgi:hypothetical protein